MLKDIINKCNALKIYEKREETDAYFEIVFYTKDLNIWEETLSSFFGAPVKPTGLKPTRDDAGITKNYGGLQANQTLYKNESKTGTVIAMLWPWQDKTHITLKIVSTR